jgi:hypothetical protein
LLTFAVWRAEPTPATSPTTDRGAAPESEPT